MNRVGSALMTLTVCLTALLLPAAPAQAVPPSRPGTAVSPLATDAGCIAQSSFGTEVGKPGNFEVVVREGNELVHYWHNNSDPNLAWTRGQVITSSATGPGCIIQSDFKGPNGHGNLEVVVQEGSQVGHYWHDSSRPDDPWRKAATFGTGVTGAPRIIQSDFLSNGHGNFEAVVPEGSSLVHYWKDNGAVGNPWRRGLTIATGISSAGSIVQSDYKGPSGHGNFEVVVRAGDHLDRYWHDNTNVENPWQYAGSFGTGATGAPSLIQSSFGREFPNGHGTLEVASREGSNLVHHFKPHNGAWTRGQTIATGVNSYGSLIQSTIGAGQHKNFEVVVLGGPAAEPPDSRVEGGWTDYQLEHIWHDNADITSPWRNGQTITYRGRSEKVCQLTGGFDREQLKTTTNDTANRGTMTGTDLGYPVDDGNQLTLFFGDSRPDDGPVNEFRLDDAVAESNDTALPTMINCLDMALIADNNNYTPPKVYGPEIMQGLFNVPSSGFSAGGDLYGIFWTDHCWDMDSATSECRSTTPGTNKYGRGVLARRNADRRTYTNLFTLPIAYNYTAAFNANHVAGIPAGQNLGVYVYGVNLYRQDYPTLAYVPSGSAQNPAAWRYFAGRDASENPIWSTDPGAGRKVFDTGDPETGCIGEFSVSWVAPLGKWLMLYNCQLPGVNGGSVRARLANAPWGPWSAPTEVFHPGTDQAWCHYMHEASRVCDTADEWGNLQGDPYGPYVLSRFTRATPQGAAIYFAMSTWNPYQTVVMRMNLRSAP
ncbi:MAG: DUF4185 domain-containing protein [Micromonosporaceae bacterium]